MESDATILAWPAQPGACADARERRAFSCRPWRVQDFDISMVCGIEVKLCHNLPVRGAMVSHPPCLRPRAGRWKIFRAGRNSRRRIGI